MTTIPRSYQVEFTGSDIEFKGFVNMRVEARAEHQDGAWLLMYLVPTYKEVGYAETLQDVMEWANNNFGRDEE